jgi:hypothetical protein
MFKVKFAKLVDKPSQTTDMRARFPLFLLFLVAASVGADEQTTGYRCFPLKVPAQGHAGFTLMDPRETGIDFTNTLSDQNAAQNQIRLNGSGVALGDVDGDGLCDIFVCSLEGRVALYKNLGGWRFTNVTATAGLDFPGNFSTGATFADVDGNGTLDLLINGIGTGTRLFLNDGHGHFTEAKDSGLIHEYGAMTCALGDMDGNGTLALYVANYRTTTIRSTGFSLLNMDGHRTILPEDSGHLEMTPEGRVLENGEPHVLYRNDGHGHFTPLSWTDGTFLDEEGHALKEVPHDWGLTAAFRDLNGDGLPDLYVCNDFHSPDRIWINDGHRHFRAIPKLAIRHTPTFSMAVDFADVDRDGRDDILVSDMMSRDHGRRLMQIAEMAPYTIRVGDFADRPQLDRTALQWNRGDGTYAEIAAYAGLDNCEWNWSVIFLDVDLDGYEDVLATTGHMFDTQDGDAQARIAANGPYPRARVPQKLLMLPPLREGKLAFRNRGDLTFSECSAAWGFDQVGVAHGAALGDLDNDGDLDLVVNNLNAGLGVYRNESAAPRVSVRLKGRSPNTAGIGARITVSGGPVTQSQEMMCGGRYLSCDEALRVFAAGNVTNRLRIEVAWRSGRHSTVTDAQPNCLYEIFEPSDGSAQPTGSTQVNSSVHPAPPPVFEDVSERLNHTHHEDPFDDFERQPLLPRRLSQLGPGVGWFDLDGDGWDDLMVASGKGGRLAVFRNDGQGHFQRLEESPWNQDVSRDQTTVVGWTGPDGSRRLLVGAANYEDGQATGAAVNEFVPGQAAAAGVIPAGSSSVGPLAMADYEGTGQLGVFVGGRSVPGRYPEAAQSQLWRQRGGRWELDAENTARLTGAGMVSGAVWSDLDGDGWPELILACEWGPVRVFHNDRGHLREITSDLGLAGFPGWWNGVTVGDFEGDGNMDIVACNWGLNTVQHASPEFPYVLYAGDFADSGALNLLEATRDPATLREEPERDLDSMAAALPFLRARFPTYASYALATVQDIAGPALAKAQRLSVTTLSSMLFLNRANHFVAVPLPREAQFAPAFGACVADYDGDGNEDVFLSQNFFATQPKIPRCDAGRGLWLQGDGHGGFRAVPGSESGIAVYGEQRGAAVGDFDGDGRVDLVVAQNGAQTRLFRNVRGRAGLRVRLLGPAGNPQGIGGVIRLKFGGRFGPAREVHAGSGYWSQDSSTEVLGCPEEPKQIWVRWPGGQTTLAEIPAGAREVAINPHGELKVVR